MATNKLTDRSVKAAKSNEKIQKMSDGGGLQLWVMPTGAKLWRIAYRYGGKQKLMALGKYPDLSLNGAREALAEARGSLVVPGHGCETVRCAGHAAILNPVAASVSRALCSALI